MRSDVSSKPWQGLFVTFEGLDGSGKTTQLKYLREYLESLGRRVRVHREPGGTKIGEKIRTLLLDGDDMAPWTEASLFAAARAELIEQEVRPALLDGCDILLDRYVDSSYAYQGHARELDLEALRLWNERVTQGLVPDRTILLGFPAEDTASRLGRQLRLFPVHGASGPPDRMERESIEFRRRVEDAYLLLAEAEPERFVLIDGTAAKKSVAKQVRESIGGLLTASVVTHA